MVVFNSLPVKPLRVTSKFGKRNTGINGASSYHKGVDLGRDFSKNETVVYSVSNGVIEKNYWNDTRGWVVVINHHGYKTLYQHLKQQSNIAVGKTVKAGQSIGIMGATSKTIKNMAVHLHFELIINGDNVDPLPYLKNIQPLEVDELTESEIRSIIRDEINKSQALPSSWAKDAWRWGKDLRITDGSSPQSLCTREQIVTMLKRFYDLFMK